MQRLIMICAGLMLLLAGCKTTTSQPAPPIAPKPQVIKESPGTPKMRTTTASPAPAAAKSYAHYVNARYGFSVQYPRSFRAEPPPVNGDGQAFDDGQGFKMIASASNNIDDTNLAAAMQKQMEGFGEVTYKARGKNWFVLSGYNGSKILYEKTYIGKGSIHGLYLEYPATAKTKYDDIVTRIARSFKPGNVEEFH